MLFRHVVKFLLRINLFSFVEDNRKVSGLESKKVRFMIEGKEMFCSGSTDKISEKNVKGAVKKADWNGRKLNFNTNNDKDLKRLLNVIYFNITSSII